MIAQNSSAQATLLLSIKKAQWTLNKVTTMIEQDKYCADIAQQINAAMWLLKSANNTLLANHLTSCWASILHSWDTIAVDAFVKELIRVWEVTHR